MSDETIKMGKKNIIAIGRLLWEKDLASVLNGNISVRVDDDKILLTAGKTCLGLLQEKDILFMNLQGELLEEGNISTETLLHTEIYRNFPVHKAVIHTHTTFTNAYFVHNNSFSPQVFESKFWLGEIQAVDQKTPSVTNASAVIEALKSNNIIVLKNHGIVAMAQDLFDCFLLVQSLEDAIKVDAIGRLYQTPPARKRTPAAKTKKPSSKAATKTTRKASSKNVKGYKLFSSEQIDEIVRLVNADKQMKELGEKTNMTMDLAVKLEETGQVYCFHFQKGAIRNVSQDEKAEFLITAPELIWRAVFNREIDPFVATTQKKMHLHGDFGRISKWYAPCSRIFELWQQVPVEG